MLYFIEQGLMPKTGKRYEWEVGVASGDPLSATFQDYDWADEVLHAADRPRVVHPAIREREGSPRVRRPVLVENSDPTGRATKRKASRSIATGGRSFIAPPASIGASSRIASVLAFETSYQVVRPDLKEISVSG